MIFLESNGYDSYLGYILFREISLFLISINSWRTCPNNLGNILNPPCYVQLSCTAVIEVLIVCEGWNTVWEVLGLINA